MEVLEGRWLCSTTRHVATPFAAAAGAAVPAAPIVKPARKSASAPATVRGASTPDNFFPVGVWYQPTYLMSHWKDEGVNTLVGYETEGGGTSLETWNAAANANGMYMIREPRKNAAADKPEANLLAWLLPDEPDLHGTSAATLAKTYAAWKKVAPNMPVFGNFAGGYVLGWQGHATSKTYQSYFSSVDWGSSDIYPVTGWNLPSRLWAPGASVQALSAASGGKPQFAIIETSNQNLWWTPKGTHGVTSGQFRAEVWQAINAGAKGIIYFPQQIGGFAYDATPASVLSEMKYQDARLADLGGALQSPLNPAGLGLNLASPLQGSWRSYGGKSYYIVTNTANASLDLPVQFVGASAAASADVRGEGRSVALQPDGSFTDHFAKYETHVYVVG